MTRRRQKMEIAALFIGLVMGHFLGDYVLQNKTMRFGKSKKGFKGMAICTIHCLIYTACVYFFLWTLNPGITANLWVILAIFLSHWPIDRWSLAWQWIKFFRNFEKDDPFGRPFYMAVDNFFHILIMFYLIRWLTS
jgi:hypothetical protein